MRRSLYLGGESDIPNKTLYLTKKSALMLYSTAPITNKRQSARSKSSRNVTIENTEDGKRSASRHRNDDRVGSANSNRNKNRNPLDLAYSLTAKNSAGIGNHSFAQKIKT